MLKVMTVIGTRPEIIKLSRVIAQLDVVVDHTLVHTGQNYDYELNGIFFDQMKVRKPDYFLEVAATTPAETIANVIKNIDKVLEKVSPDALLVLGDTNSCLSVLSAKRRKIPIFHMEAGNRCFDARVPEEINRTIIDHMSDINLPYTDIAREYLLREGLPASQIIKTGSPMKEVLDYFKPQIDSSNIIDEMGLRDNEFYLVSAHREENVDVPVRLNKFIDLLSYLANRNQGPVIVSTHPRTRKKIEAIGVAKNENIIFHKPFSFFDYVALQKSATCVFSDSGTITEESSILGFPALNIRDAHERPEGFEEGAVMMVGIETARVKAALDVLQLKGVSEKQKLIKDYDVDNVSVKIIKIILSYTDYVNRVVWKK
ncbi:UDP-N-acetylglucosamine 2-epimerase (non-hydrolyzing) [Alphaproteobacteria bacterium]|nr:UDP-N-acetylglucosamine 2-epimerase (non-hydrolyzing) [Alphaproteobacteria bacterium]